jgi:uncharacterized GH25 family protein
MSSIGPSALRWLIVAALLWSVPARAHDFWIEPSTYRPLPGMSVSVTLRVGQDFVGDSVPYMADSIDAFFVRQDGDDETLFGSEGLAPASSLRASGTATAIVAYSSAGSITELPADRFEAYLEQYGLDDIISERLRRGEDTSAARECFYRYAKALLTGAAPSASVTQPLPFAYEIVPDADPTAGFGAFDAHIFYDGEPLANALVEALHRQDPSVRLSVRSDAHGAFSLALPRSGVWLVKSVHMVRAGFFSDCDWQSSWASLTFEMPGKGP